MCPQLSLKTVQNYLHLYLLFLRCVFYSGVYRYQIPLIYSEKLYSLSPIHPNTIRFYNTSTQSSKHPFKHPPIHPPNQPTIQSSIYPFNNPSEQSSIYSLIHSNITINSFTHPPHHPFIHCWIFLSPVNPINHLHNRPIIQSTINTITRPPKHPSIQTTFHQITQISINLSSIQHPYIPSTICPITHQSNHQFIHTHICPCTH